MHVMNRKCDTICAAIFLWVVFHNLYLKLYL